MYRGPSATLRPPLHAPVKEDHLSSPCNLRNVGLPAISRQSISIPMYIDRSHQVLYLGGLALGGAWGFREGAGRPLAVSNAWLRINSILNSVTRRGTFLGNKAGVLALGYNVINSTIDAVRGKHDAFGSMVAGALTGALFKSTAGVKPALAAATIVSASAGVWSWVKTRV